MPATKASGTRIKALVYNHLNASVGVAHGTYSDNPRYTRESILDEIIASDYDYAVAICHVSNHSERPAFAQAPVTLTQPALNSSTILRLPSSIGEVDVPLITRTDGVVVQGNTATPNWIDILRNDATNQFGTPAIKEGLYATLNGTVRFTGASITFTPYDVQHGTWTGANGAEVFTLRSPEQCESVIAAFTLAKLLAKQEDFMGAAQHYMTIARAGFDSIGAGEMPIQKLELYQQQR